MAMSNLDWLTAVATGVGQGKQMQEQRQMAAQQRQDVLRQQALENAMARQRLDLQRADFEWEKEEAVRKQKAVADIADLQSQRRLSMLQAIPSAQERQIGTRQIGAFQPSAMLPPEQSAIQLGAGVPGARERLFAPFGTLGGPELENVPLGPTQPIMEPVTQRIEDMSEPELIRYILDKDLADIQIGAKGELTVKPYTREEQITTGLETRKLTADVTSAEAKADYDYNAVTNRLALLGHQVTSAGHKAIADKLAIAPAALEELKATIGLAHTTEFLNSYYNLLTKELKEGYSKADVGIVRNRAVEDFINEYGVEPTVWNMLQVLGIREEELKLKIARPPSTPSGEPTPKDVRKEWSGMVDDQIKRYNDNPAYTSEAAVAAIKQIASGYDIPASDPYLKAAILAAQQPKKQAGSNLLVNPMGIGQTW